VYKRQVLVALGSNLGDPAGSVHRALEILRTTYANLRASSLYQTKPVGCAPGAPDYVNACARFETELTPEQLLQALRSLEALAGRPVRRTKNEDRTLDVDIIAIDGVQCDTEALSLPHPRAHTRAFVLVPAIEIAPEFMLVDGTVQAAHARLSHAQIAELVRSAPPLRTVSVHAESRPTSRKF
jgi:2-amino-4-hydroxy-6-hydroxymethyldihydropteridine diphosphokinase